MLGTFYKMQNGCKSCSAGTSIGSWCWRGAWQLVCCRDWCWV